MLTTTGSTSVNVRILPNGETILSSGDPWYRLFRALADLFIAGEIDADTLDGEIVAWYVGPDRKGREFRCPAAQALASKIMGVLSEPPCICWAYQDGPPCIRGCTQTTEDDRRTHLAAEIGA